MEKITVAEVAAWLGCTEAEAFAMRERPELDTEQAAEMLGISAQTVRMFIESGDIPAFVYRRRGSSRCIYRISRAALLAFRQRMKRTGWDELRDELRQSGRGVLRNFAGSS